MAEIVPWDEFVKAVEKVADISSVVSANRSDQTRHVVVKIQGEMFWKKAYTEEVLLYMPKNEVDYELLQQLHNAWLRFLEPISFNDYWEIPRIPSLAEQIMNDGIVSEGEFRNSFNSVCQNPECPEAGKYGRCVHTLWKHDVNPLSKVPKNE